MSNFSALVAKIEHTIDAHPFLTRKRPSGFLDRAKLEFTGDGDWVARIAVTRRGAKGRGARTPMEINGDHDETPEGAVASLLDQLPTWTEVLK